jgi:hypothetical protein
MSYVVTVFGVALPMAVACAVLFLIALQLGSDTRVAGLRLGHTGPCLAPGVRPKKIVMRWNPSMGI